MRRLSAFLADESGQTAIEYGLIAAVCSIGIIASLQIFGVSVTSMFEGVLVAFNRGE
jgi:pilus assembly protein Flp/PilA